MRQIHSPVKNTLTRPQRRPFRGQVKEINEATKHLLAQGVGAVEMLSCLVANGRRFDVLFV